MSVTIAMPRMSTDPELTTAQSKYVESLARAGAEVHWVALSDPDAAVAEALTCDGLLLPNHFLNDLVLLLLVIVAASYRYDYLHRIALFCFQITFYYICHCIDKRVVRCICHDTNTQHMIGFCVLLSAACQ